MPLNMYAYELKENPRQAAVLNKYSEAQLLDTIEKACHEFYATIHQQFFAGQDDYSDGDLECELVNLALEYMWDNDRELQDIIENQTLDDSDDPMVDL